MFRLFTARPLHFMSSSYYLARPITTPQIGLSLPRRMAPESLSLDEIPTLSLLYKLKKITSADDLDFTFEASNSLNDKISVIRQDITTLAVDCIVNAANGSLLGGGGVDGAIHRAAGPKLYEECETLNGCDTGSAKITNGYELPSKKVIHAVGPIYWKEDRGRAAELLSGCYRTSLQLAVDNGCKSIAFSAISTGVYGYPSHEASLVALETVRKFLDEAGKAEQMDRVIFCNFLQKDEDAYFKNIPNFFPLPKSENKEEAGDNVGTDDGSISRQEQPTEPSELLSQLPDAPTIDPQEGEDVQQPSLKKQKINTVEDDFVIVKKEDATEGVEKTDR